MSHKKNKLFFFFKSVVVLVLLTLVIATAGCRSTALKTSAALKAPEGVSLPEVEALSQLGTNYRARISADGLKMIFISRDREKHRQPQVYESIFASKFEKRLTYQDGEIYDAIYSYRKNYFFYASSTDEIKENPFFMQNMMATSQTANPAPGASALNSVCGTCDVYGQPLPMTEIYESNFDGTQIRRLTDTQNFDGAMSLRPDAQQMAFISVRNKAKQLFSLNIQTRELTRIGGARQGDDSPEYSRNGRQLLWSHVPLANIQSSEIWRGDSHAAHPQAIIHDRGLNVDPSWHPSGEEFVFASTRDDINDGINVDRQAVGDAKTINFEIFVAKKDGTCIRRLTYHSAVDRWPVISPDGKKLIFTSDRSGVMQIYRMDYRPSACPN